MSKIFRIQTTDGQNILAKTIEEMNAVIGELGDRFKTVRKLSTAAKTQGAHVHATETLNIRVAPETKAYLAKRAEELGLRGISEYIKTLILMDRELKILTTMKNLQIAEERKP